MALRFINLTPYPVKIWSQGREDRETVFPTSGRTVRIKFSKKLSTASELVQLVVVEPISMSDLPIEVARDLRYIVSESVFKFIDDRKDFVYPSTIVRSRDGGVSAYQCLGCHPADQVKEFFRTHYEQLRIARQAPVVQEQPS